MFKNTAYMTISTIARLLTGVVLFIVLARLFGPEDFGRLIYGFTLASIAVLLVDYGFSQQLLREIGRSPENVRQIMGRVFLAKLLLTGLMAALCLLATIIFPRGAQEEAIFWLLLVSCVLASFGDFFNVAFRGIGQFHQETKVATIGSLLHFALLLIMALMGASLVMIALGFVLSRAIYLALSWTAYSRIVGGLDFANQSAKTAVGALKSGFPYAADAGFTNFFSQVDTIIVQHYLGATGVGVYQAGMRFLNGAMQFAPVLANVYLPAIAGKAAHPEQLSQLAKKLTMQLLVVGVVGWAVFSFAGEQITALVFGAQYSALNSLWPYIGLLLFVRYLAASQGVLLTAIGAQSIRVWAQIFALLVLLVSSPWLITQFGLIGMLIALVITTTALVFIYTGVAVIRRFTLGLNPMSLFLIFGVLALTARQIRA